MSPFRNNPGHDGFNSALINFLDPSGADGESDLSTQAGYPVGLALNIDIESPFGPPMGMGNLMSETGSGARDLTNA